MLVFQEFVKFLVLTKKLLWKFIIFLKETNMQNFPNIITCIRLAAPFYFIILIIIFKNQNTQSLIIFFTFVILSITDYLDGFLARKFNVSSDFGKIFDPISDKILTTSALIYLSSINTDILFPSVLIIFREFLISGVREFSLLKRKESVNVSILSKIKTALQFITISLLLITFGVEDNLFFEEFIKAYQIVNFCLCGLWIVTFLTLYTGFQYCYKVFKI